ncbi:histidine kinase [Marinomonas piezotolerans]|uniref:Histidine kinase n=1 Tax=Marinomonas piezotolerans TaxID=2213058 RepID=A0A370UCB1_9GAMM|nr:CBS domain-containing protein [Marinomonas piezotolerans]RDL45430.1 histidine kinase [Marinomonas piezotolerans]
MSIDALTVREIMSRDTFHVYPDTRIDDCARQLAARKLSGAPVTDHYDNLIGFVSEQDLLEPLMQAVYYCNRPKEVSSVMSQDVLSLTPKQQVMQIAKVMTENKPKIYPVVEEGRLVGIVTRRHVTLALLQGQDTCVPV